MEKTKVTKRNFYETIIALATEGPQACEIVAEDIVAFCNKEIAALEKRAERTREARAQKKAEADILMEKVKEALNVDDYQLISDVTEAVATANPELEVTTYKVTYRLNALVNEGIAEKQGVKEGKRVLQGYKLV